MALLRDATQSAGKSECEKGKAKVTARGRRRDGNLIPLLFSIVSVVLYCGAGSLNLCTRLTSILNIYSFVRLFGESGYDEGFLEGHATSVTRAYREFLHCVKDEVTRVEATEASDYPFPLFW